jgi:hypothetical protein
VTVKVVGHPMIRIRPWQGGPRTPTASRPAGFGQDDLDALSRLDCRRGWPRAASRFPGRPARGLQLQVMNALYQY